MKLKSDLTWGEDFMLVSQTVWTKLIRFFGGAFEIPYFLVDKVFLKDQSEEVPKG
jgi:hypothetical protein